MESHSPGPWKFKSEPSRHFPGKRNWRICLDRGPASRTIAMIHGCGDQADARGRKISNIQGEANACLMAAAPDLLTTCRDALEAIIELQDNDDGGLISPARLALTNAIAKAEGRS